MDKNEEHKQWFPTKQLLGVVQRKAEFLLSEMFWWYQKISIKALFGVP